MPRPTMRPIRRKALIDAAIIEIGQRGSLDVTVGGIARRAGVSSALAHHYFGGKDDILIAAMRQILRGFADHVRIASADAKTPLQHLEAIITASFHPSNFTPDVIAAWLAFYVQAQNSKQAQRLLQVYTRRLHSNLVYNLRQCTNAPNATLTGHGIAALIDGFYLRHALQSHVPARGEAVAITREYLHQRLERTPDFEQDKPHCA